MGYNNEFASSRAWMCFDIETAPMPECADYLTDPIEAPANYKDPDKIAAFVAGKRAAQIEKAALDLDLCEVIAIGGAFADSEWCQTRATASEAEMIEGVWRFVRTLQKEGGQLVGFCCLAFDLPVLIRRSMYLGLSAPSIAVDKYRHDGVLDLADILTFSGKVTQRSLSFYCQRFGIPCDLKGEGANMPALAAAGDWAAVETHCRHDIEATRALALRIGAVRPVEVAA